MKEQVRRDVGLSVTGAQMEQVLVGKPCSMDEKAHGMIRKQGRRYAATPFRYNRKDLDLAEMIVQDRY